MAARSTNMLSGLHFCLLLASLYYYRSMTAWHFSRLFRHCTVIGNVYYSTTCYIFLPVVDQAFELSELALRIFKRLSFNGPVTHIVPILYPTSHV